MAIKKYLEPRQIAISKGISFEEALKIVRESEGETRYWCSHVNCLDGDAPIALTKKIEVPYQECPNCKEEIGLDNLEFEEIKVVEYLKPKTKIQEDPFIASLKEKIAQQEKEIKELRQQLEIAEFSGQVQSLEEMQMTSVLSTCKEAYFFA